MRNAPRLGSAAAMACCPTGVVAVNPDVTPRPADTGGPGTARPRSLLSTAGVLLACVLCSTALAGCGWVSGWFEDDAPKPQAVSVLKVSVGQCFTTPQEEHVELTEIDAVPCDVAHRQESYAVLKYQPPAGVQANAYPGDALLTDYAKAACAEAFEPYVGVSYLNSKLYFTYLIPTARGWQESGDESVVCFATTTGEELSSSVKGTRW